MKIDFKYILGAFVFIFLLGGYVIYTFAKGKTVDVGNGDDIPAGWNPTGASLALYDAMAGIGTNEEVFFATLSPLTKGQRAMVYNDYNLNHGDLIDDIKSEFSGDELQRALSFFTDIKGVSANKWTALFKPLR